MKREKITSIKKIKQLSQKQVMLLGLGGGLVLGIGYLTFTHFRNNAAAKRSIMDSSYTDQQDTISPVQPIINTDSFPMKRGAKGELVAMLQNALIAKGGSASLIIKETSFRNGRVDGIFGRGTARALRAAGYPSVITQATFSAIVGNRNMSTINNAAGIAKQLIEAANTRNLFGVLNGLKMIKDVTAYQRVSTFFQGIRINGTRVTSLVNALLSVAFKKKELEKIKIRSEFRRIGLKQDAKGIWFMPNLGSIAALFENTEDASNYKWNLAIAEKPTLLKATDGSFIVPELRPQTVIGYITGIKNGMTRILTQSGEMVFAPTKNLTAI